MSCREEYYVGYYFTVNEFDVRNEFDRKRSEGIGSHLILIVLGE